MPEAAKPATDKAANPAVETDAAKKEKAAADGALDKMKSEVADATKPGEKKTEDAAKTDDKKTDEKKPEEKKPEEKKTEEVVKKPEEAKKPEDDSLFNRLYDGVGNTWSALWNIRQPEKSTDTKAISDAAKTPVLKGQVEYLDLNAPIVGYDAKKTEAALEAKKTDAAVTEPAKDGGGIWGWLGDKASDAGKWVKETFWEAKAEKADKVLDSFSEIKIDDAKYEYKAIEKENGLYDVLTKKNDGGVCKISDTSCTRTFGEIETTYDRKEKTSYIYDKETKTSYERLKDGTQIVSQADGVKYVKQSDGSYMKVVGDQITTISGEEDKRIISQKLGELEMIYRQGHRLDVNRLGHLPCRDNKTVEAGENYKYTTSADGKTTYGYVGGKQFAVVEDKSTYVFDPRTKQAIHLDANGKELERGTAAEFAKRVPGLVVTPDGRIRFEGNPTTFQTDAATGQTTTTMTDVSGKKIVNTSAGPNGVETTQMVDANGKVMSQSDINHNDPSKLFVDKDAEGKVVSTYNSTDNSYSAADGSFKFTENGTELFGGEVFVNSSGDVSYSDGVRLSNSSPGAIQASEAAAISASSNATSVASALSAKAGNPATVSAGDLSACYGAYGNIVAAMNACLTSGNFAGFGQCMAAKGALESAIGVIAPKLVAMENASKAGLSGYALNEVGQKTTLGATNYQAIEDIRNRQNGVSQTA